MSYLPFGAGVYYLQSSIGSTDTSITLSSFTEPVSGTVYTMANIGSDIVYGTIAPKTANSEFISFTGITANSDGTATLTGVTRGLAKKTPFTTSSTFKLPHSGQTQFIISNPPQLYNEYVTLDNAETIVGKKTFPAGGNANAPVSGASYSAPTADLEYASKKYVDDTAIAGAPDATLTVKGIVEIATTAEIDADTATGATGASIVARPDQLVLSKYGTRLPTANEKSALVGNNTDIAVGTGNKYVTQTGLQDGAEVYAASSAGSDTYAITLSPVPTAYHNGMTLKFKADVANTGAATLNVNSLGAVSLVTSVGTALATGDIVANQIVEVIYNSTGPVFEVVNPASAVLIPTTYTNGISSRAFNAGAGAVTYAHGLGKTPKKIKITTTMTSSNGTVNSYSFGSYNGTTNSNVYKGENSNGQGFSGSDNTNVLTVYNVTNTSTTPVTATATFDATNITLTYSADVGTGTFYIMWEAEG